MPLRLLTPDASYFTSQTAFSTRFSPWTTPRRPSPAPSTCSPKRALPLARLSSCRTPSSPLSGTCAPISPSSRSFVSTSIRRHSTSCRLMFPPSCRTASCTSLDCSERSVSRRSIAARWRRRSSVASPASRPKHRHRSTALLLSGYHYRSHQSRL